MRNRLITCLEKVFRSSSVAFGKSYLTFLDFSFDIHKNGEGVLWRVLKAFLESFFFFSLKGRCVPIPRLCMSQRSGSHNQF